MKLVRIYTGEDDESHIEERPIDFSEREGMRSVTEPAEGVLFVQRPEGGFTDFHPAPRLQYVLYLTASVEIGLGDGSKVVMEPGDVLRAEDTTGHGHTSTVVKPGVCAFVQLKA